VAPPERAESLAVAAVQSLIVASAVGLFLLPLATPEGLVAGLVGTIAVFLPSAVPLIEDRVIAAAGSHSSARH